MNQSTLAMACNSSGGWFDVDLASQLGIVSFVSFAPRQERNTRKLRASSDSPTETKYLQDWSNHKAAWAAAKPMSCEYPRARATRLEISAPL